MSDEKTVDDGPFDFDIEYAKAVANVRLERTKFINKYSGPIVYRGYWRREHAIKAKMEATGRPVRCIDCSERKKCNHVRVNKFKLEPCKDFIVDLQKQANLMETKYKKK